MQCMQYDSKRARARSRPRLTSSGDTETLIAMRQWLKKHISPSPQTGFAEVLQALGER